MKIKSRLFVSFLLIILFSVFLQFLSAHKLKKVENLLKEDLLASVENLTYSKQVLMLVQALQFQQENLFLNTWRYVEVAEKKWKDEYSRGEIGSETLIKKLEVITSGDDLELFQNIKFATGALLDEYRSAIRYSEMGHKDKALQLLSANKIQNYRKIIQAQNSEYFQRHGIDLDQVDSSSNLTMDDHEIRSIIDRSRIMIKNHITFLMIFVGLMIGLSFLLSYFVSVRITKSINILTHYVERMLRGNWSLKIPHVSNDEIGALANSFNDLSETLKAISTSRQELTEKFQRHKLTERSLEVKRQELEEQKIGVLNLMEDAEEARKVSEKATEDIKKTATALSNSNKELLESAQLLKRQQKKLVQAEKMSALGVMAAGVAHELNNPLMGILNYVQYAMKKVPKEDKVFSVLQDAEKETKRCSKIISDILIFSRSRNLHEKKQTTRVSLKDFFDQIMHRFEMRMKKEGITLFLDFSSDSIEVDMDQQEMESVMINLIGNAMDAMKDSQRRELHILVSDEAKTVKIEVRDTGTGMSQDTVSKIFDPFYTTKPTGQGTGLGLAICSTIMKEHDGELLCESVMGEGTTFRLVLPKNNNL